MEISREFKSFYDANILPELKKSEQLSLKRSEGNKNFAIICGIVGLIFAGVNYFVLKMSLVAAIGIAGAVVFFAILFKLTKPQRWDEGLSLQY